MARILVVDDDRELLEVLGEWLGYRGHVVRLVDDGLRAVQEARSFAPDVVLLDAVLCGTTGPAVAEVLRDGGFGSIVYLTGLPTSILPADAPVLEKPIDLERLERTIQRLVDRRATDQLRTEAASQAR